MVFLSNRDNGTTHLFVTHLARLAADPDDPLNRANEEDDGETAFRVDPDGIDGRVTQLTSGGSSVGNHFLSEDGQTIYFTSRDEDGPGLFSVDIDGGERRKITGGSFNGIVPTADAKSAFFMQGGRVGGGEYTRWRYPLAVIPESISPSLCRSIIVRSGHRSSRRAGGS